MTSARCRLLASMLLLAARLCVADESPFQAAIETAQARVVKIHGASFGRQQGYGSGIVVAPGGMIVTTLGALLESPSLRVVLPDGRRLAAQVVARDARRQLAILRIDAADLPSFELGDSAHLRPGDWVIAAANPFKVAEGPEPVSIAVGVLAARADLAARRKAQDFPYDGPVLFTDMIVATPGSAGGALVEKRGRLVGIIGKSVDNTRTNTVANYALPVEEIAAFVREFESGATTAVVSADPASAPSSQPAIQAAALSEVGLTLFDMGGRVRPAYVERVRRDSPADRAGLRSGDLILSVGGEPIATCADVAAKFAALSAGGRSIALTIKRGGEVKAIELPLGEASR